MILISEVTTVNEGLHDSAATHSFWPALLFHPAWVEGIQSPFSVITALDIEKKIFRCAHSCYHHTKSPPFLWSNGDMIRWWCLLIVSLSLLISVASFFAAVSDLASSVTCLCYFSETNSIMWRTCKNDNQRVRSWLLARCCTGSCMCKWGN